MPLIYLLLSAIFWLLLRKLIPEGDVSAKSAALLCSAQKTLAFGIPFIKTALGNRPDIAYILAPLLIYAPAQLILGSALFVPALAKLISKSAKFQDGDGI